MTNKQIRLLRALGIDFSIVDNIGKKNYEKLLEENKYEYIYPDQDQSPYKILKTMHDTIEKKANIYKGHNISMEYTDKLINDYIPSHNADMQDNKSTVGVTITNKKLLTDTPKTKYFEPLLLHPYAGVRNAIGHELGHAKEQIELNKKKLAIYKKYPGEADKDKREKLINKLNKKHTKISEEKADKNILPYLRQMGIDKKNRRAHLFLYRQALIEKLKENNKQKLSQNEIQKNTPEDHKKDVDKNSKNKKQQSKNLGRYLGRFGNLKYIKDYILAFSNGDNFVKKYKKII